MFYWEGSKAKVGGYGWNPRLKCYYGLNRMPKPCCGKVEPCYIKRIFARGQFWWDWNNAHFFHFWALRGTFLVENLRQTRRIGRSRLSGSLFCPHCASGRVVDAALIPLLELCDVDVPACAVPSSSCVSSAIVDVWRIARSRTDTVPFLSDNMSSAESSGANSKYTYPWCTAVSDTTRFCSALPRSAEETK